MLLVGDDVDPRHGGVGVGNHVVAAIVVEAAVLVVELQVAPYAEVAFGTQHGVFHLVLVVLVGHLEAAQLLGDGDAFGGGEGEACHHAQQRALGIADVVAVEDIDLAGVAVGGPKVFGVGHAQDEVGQGVALLVGGIVDEDEVEQQPVDLVVFESAEEFLGESRTLHGVYFEEDDGQVAADAEAPEAALREGVPGEEVVSVVAEGGGLRHVFGQGGVELHLASLEEGEGCPHVVENGCGLEGMLHVEGRLVLPGELEQLFAGFAEGGQEEGFGFHSRLDMESATHGKDGVEGGADGAGEGAAALDDIGAAQTAATAEEVHARCLVLDESG